MSFVLGVTLAALVFFVWSAISWMALPWQRGVFKEFRDEEKVAQFLADEAPTTGIYGLPAEPRYPVGSTKEQRDAIDQIVWNKMQSGPLVFAVVSRERFAPFPKMLAIALVGNVAVSLIFGWMLRNTTGLGYGERVVFILLGGVAAGISCRIPDWNWHKFPWNHTLINIASLAIGWLLSGLVLAGFVRGRA
ncbi:MAG: hypothetical protein HY049_13200 [Acidobacteria bacterium]|nr:hypothetical protein [Acidobacteriota bacterium]